MSGNSVCRWIECTLLQYSGTDGSTLWLMGSMYNGASNSHHCLLLVFATLPFQVPISVYIFSLSLVNDFCSMKFEISLHEIVSESHFRSVPFIFCTYCVNNPLIIWDLVDDTITISYLITNCFSIIIVLYFMYVYILLGVCLFLIFSFAALHITLSLVLVLFN